MLISIIISTFNSEKTIQSNIESIKSQTYKNYQIIVVDNNSSDQTINIIKKNNLFNVKFFIEDDLGVFDAINKGINHSSGDIISVLHSDDFYNDKDVLENVVKKFNENKKNDIIYGNLVYVRKNDINQTLRYWKPGIYKKNSFYKGWHPPHPSFFAKKKLFLDYGLYDLRHGNCADVELMFRFLNIHNIQSGYLNKTLIKMRYGGASNKNIFTIINQNIQILKFLKITRNYYKISVFILYKFLDRLKQFVIKE
jgi:glycosyltransferase involved in cell wall biosynthesis